MRRSAPAADRTRRGRRGPPRPRPQRTRARSPGPRSSATPSGSPGPASTGDRRSVPSPGAGPAPGAARSPRHEPGSGRPWLTSELDLLQTGVDGPGEAADLAGVQRGERGALALVELEPAVEHFLQRGPGILPESPAQTFVRREQADDAFHAELTHGVSISHRCLLKEHANLVESRPGLPVRAVLSTCRAQRVDFDSARGVDGPTLCRPMRTCEQRDQT